MQFSSRAATTAAATANNHFQNSSSTQVQESTRMRVSLNLASRRYVELRPLYKRLRLLIGILAVVAVACWFVLRTEYVRAKDAQARVDAIQAEVDRVQNEQRRDQAEMRQPKEAGILHQAQFLNQLFLSKAFSWTAVMIELERVLPAGVQVTNIDPQLAKNGHVTVRLRVQGQHDRAVDLMRNLEKSQRFLLPRLTGESAENSGQNSNVQNASLPGTVNFEIVADYNPLPLKTAKEDATPMHEAASHGKDATEGQSHRHHASGRSATAARAPHGGAQ
jgi:type IV pilus assembly protein PilN